MGILPPRFFLMRGQSDSSHAAIAFGSRSRGTRRGFCGVNPRSRSQVLRYLGLSPTPNSSRIKWPSRGRGPQFGLEAMVGRAVGQPAQGDLLLGAGELGRPARDRPGGEARPPGSR